VEGPSASCPRFQELLERVLADPLAQSRLREAIDWDRFTVLLIELAAERDIALTEEELEHESKLAQRAWREHGI
jgi:hypothetical protein